MSQMTITSQVLIHCPVFEWLFLYLLRNCLLVSVWRVRVISFNFARLRPPLAYPGSSWYYFIFFPNYISCIIFQGVEESLLESQLNGGGGGGLSGETTKLEAPDFLWIMDRWCLVFIACLSSRSRILNIANLETSSIHYWCP